MTSKDGIAVIINESDNIAVAAHIKPDGDAIGSVLGAVEVLCANGKNAFPVPIKYPPRRYNFLTGFKRFLATDVPAPGLLIALDSGDADRLPPGAYALYKDGVKTVAIDHHISNQGFGVAWWVDNGYASASIMLLDLFETMGYKITAEGAQALYLGLVTDTGNFTYSNTDANAHRAAAHLIELGAEPILITEQLDGGWSIDSVRLLGAALSKISYFHNKDVAFITLDRATQDIYLSGDDDVEDIVNYARAVSAVKLGVLFRELDDGYVKVSFRSNYGADAGALAGRLGGGGHKAASGCLIKGGLEEVKKQVFEEIKRWLTE